MQSVLCFLLLLPFFCFSQVLDEEVDGFHISLASPTPSFRIFLESNETDIYTFRLDSLFEINVKTKEKYTDTVTKFGSWNVSPVTEHSDDGITFTVSHGQNPAGGPQFSSLALVNHVYESDSRNSTCSGVACLKFDVHLNNYVWASSDPYAALVLEFSLEQEGSSSSLISPENFQVHDAYYSIFNDATILHSDGSTATVSPYLYFPANAPSKYTVWLIYDHFEGSVIHDPTVMILHLGDYQRMTMIVGGSIAGVVLLVVAIVFGMLLYKNKQRPGYESM